MHIQSIKISNLKSFALLNWALDGDIPANGWHVIIGSNGSGKSSLLQAIAYALIGVPEILAISIDISRWVRSGQSIANLELNINLNTKKDFKLKHQSDIDNEFTEKFIHFQFTDSGGWLGNFSILTKEDDIYNWFSAGFGPFRRFSGGNKEMHRLYSTHPILARHLSIFGEDVALTESLEWLRLLKFKKLEAKKEYTLLDSIKEFINQDGFLPFGAKLLDVTSEQIFFCDGNGVTIPVLELSDGYRSILSLTFELIRLMSDCYPTTDLFSQDKMTVIVSGVVLIDEVDAHLHPNWQREIGPWLCRLFPQIQFIVTTHSTFVCQEATSIWRLPDPGTDDEFKRVTGEELTRLKYGDATLALETHAFGLEQNRSDKANELLDELAALNLKASSGELSDQEAKRHKELKTLLQPVLP